MKKTLLTLALLNVYAMCTASSTVGRQTAYTLAKNNSQRSLSTGIAKPATRNKAAKAQELAQQKANLQSAAEREVQIKEMNQALSSQSSYSYNNLNNATNSIANAVPANSIQNAVPLVNAAPSGFSTFDKAYLGGGFATVAAMFGYDALKNEESNLITTPVAAEKAAQQQQLIDNIIKDTESATPEEFEAARNELGLANISDFARKHAYEDPKNAMLNLYNNLNGDNIINALQNPVIAGAIATAALGGYAYYQYLQYLAKQAKNQENENKPMDETKDNTIKNQNYHGIAE